MNNFKCTITPKRLTPNKSGSYTYVVSGPKQMLDFYAEKQGEYLITDEKTGKLLYFSRKLYVYGGFITFVEDLEKQFVAEPNVQRALAVQAMAMSMAVSTPDFSTSDSENDSEEEDEEPELAPAPKSKPAGVKKKIN